MGPKEAQAYLWHMDVGWANDKCVAEGPVCHFRGHAWPAKHWIVFTCGCLAKGTKKSGGSEPKNFVH